MEVYFEACKNGDVKTLEKAFLDHYFNVNAFSVDSRTPMMLAALHGRAAVVELLFRKRGGQINVHLTNKNGSTALTCAANRGFALICEMLLTYGCKVDHQDNLGATPLVHACANGHFAAVKSLLHVGANVQLPSVEGMAPLTHAAAGGCVDIVNQLVCAGADVDSCSKSGLTALIAAAGNGHTACVGRLLLSNCNTSLMQDDGHNAVMAAAVNGHTECCRLLLIAPMPRRTRDINGATAFDLAVKHEHPETAAMIQAVMEEAWKNDEDEIEQSMNQDAFRSEQWIEATDYMVADILGAKPEPSDWRLEDGHQGCETSEIANFMVSELDDTSSRLSLGPLSRHLQQPRSADPRSKLEELQSSSSMVLARHWSRVGDVVSKSPRDSKSQVYHTSRPMRYADDASTSAQRPLPVGRRPGEVRKGLRRELESPRNPIAHYYGGGGGGGVGGAAGAAAEKSLLDWVQCCSPQATNRTVPS